MPNTATSPGAGQVDIDWVIGTDFVCTVTVPYLLTGSVVSFLNADDATVAHVASVPFVDGVSTSVVTLTLASALSAGLRPQVWHYNLLRTPSGSDPTPIFGGLLRAVLT